MKHKNGKRTDLGYKTCATDIEDTRAKWDMVGSITRPVMELKGFKKLNWEAGETKKVSFKISVNDLKFYNADLKYSYEPGDFKVFIGSSSADVKEAGFKLK